MQRVLDDLVGKPVTHRGIAGNSIEIWLEVEPKHEHALVFWIDAPWRLEISKSIASTSADFPWEREEGESKEAYRGRFEAACSVSDCLIGSQLIAASIDPWTSDLELIFDGDKRLRTFAVWREETWNLRNYRKNKRYRVSIEQVAIEPIS